MFCMKSEEKGRKTRENKDITILAIFAGIIALGYFFTNWLDNVNDPDTVGTPSWKLVTNEGIAYHKRIEQCVSWENKIVNLTLEKACPPPYCKPNAKPCFLQVTYFGVYSTKKAVSQTYCKPSADCAMEMQIFDSCIASVKTLDSNGDGFVELNLLVCKTDSKLVKPIDEKALNKKGNHCEYNYTEILSNWSYHCVDVYNSGVAFDFSIIKGIHYNKCKLDYCDVRLKNCGLWEEKEDFPFNTTNSHNAVIPLLTYKQLDYPYETYPYDNANINWIDGNKFYVVNCERVIDD